MFRLASLVAVSLFACRRASTPAAAVDAATPAAPATSSVLAPAPASVREPAPAPVTWLSAREYNTCAIRAGQVFCWGAGFSGKGWSATLLPTRIEAYERASAVSVGGQFACAIEDGVASCWGDNLSGQLGDGTLEERQRPLRAKVVPHGVTTIEASSGHACAIVDTQLWCWGRGGEGSPVPKRMPGFPSGVRAVAIGRAACAAPAGPGDVQCWGLPMKFRNAMGRYDDITGGLSGAPKPLVDYADAGVGGPVTAMFGGGGMLASIAIVVDGKVQLWSPLRVREDTPPLTDVTAVSASDKETCAIRRGEVVCWPTDGKTTRAVALPGRATMIASGREHHCALVDGAVYCWGTRAYPALGDGAPLCVPDYCWDSTKTYDGGRKCDERDPPCLEPRPMRVRW